MVYDFHEVNKFNLKCGTRCAIWRRQPVNNRSQAVIYWFTVYNREFLTYRKFTLGLVSNN